MEQSCYLYSLDILLRKPELCRQLFCISGNIFRMLEGEGILGIYCRHQGKDRRRYLTISLFAAFTLLILFLQILFINLNTVFSISLGIKRCPLRLLGQLICIFRHGFIPGDTYAERDQLNDLRLILRCLQHDLLDLLCEWNQLVLIVFSCDDQELIGTHTEYLHAVICSLLQLFCTPAQNLISYAFSIQLII